ncbi:hypothetical protein BH24ACT22_BH24ACT22_15010 [soil metagenome]
MSRAERLKTVLTIVVLMVTTMMVSATTVQAQQTTDIFFVPAQPGLPDPGPTTGLTGQCGDTQGPDIDVSTCAILQFGPPSDPPLNRDDLVCDIPVNFVEPQSGEIVAEGFQCRVPPPVEPPPDEPPPEEPPPEEPPPEEPPQTTAIQYGDVDESGCPVNQTSGDLDADGDVDAGDAAAVSQTFGIDQDLATQCLQILAGGDVSDVNQGGEDAGDVVVLDDEDGELLVVIEGVEIVDVDGDGVITTLDVIIFEEDCGCDVDGDGAVASASAAAASASASASSSSGSSSSGGGTLPDTGGASLFTLGAGALLVGGGLLARRIFR